MGVPKLHNKRVAPERYSPQEPPLAQVLNLWNAGHDTRAISTLLFVPESMIYNMLARVAR
jgi:hypothetical protein